jgi:uridine kinase
LQRLYENVSRPILIAIGGPGGTGKTSFARRLAQALGDSAVLALDHYKTSRRQRQQAGIYGAHPQANKMDLIAHHLQLLRRNQGCDQPVYCSTAGDAAKTHP